MSWRVVSCAAGDVTYSRCDVLLWRLTSRVFLLSCNCICLCVLNFRCCDYFAGCMSAWEGGRGVWVIVIHMLTSVVFKTISVEYVHVVWLPVHQCQSDGQTPYRIIISFTPHTPTTLTFDAAAACPLADCSHKFLIAMFAVNYFASQQTDGQWN